MNYSQRSRQAIQTNQHSSTKDDGNMRQQLKCSHYDQDGHLVDQCFYLHGFPIAYKARASTPQPFKDSPQNRQHSQLKNITRSCPYWKKKMVIINPL